uniref:Ataxin 7 like 1 n=1 Tax=Marmota marmota marmota TaxID=9994 RepID=A0A8C6EVV7_MARMA
MSTRRVALPSVALAQPPYPAASPGCREDTVQCVDLLPLQRLQPPTPGHH